MKTPVALTVVQLRCTIGVVTSAASHLTVWGTLYDRIVWPVGAAVGVAVGRDVAGGAVGAAAVGVAASVVAGVGVWATVVAAETGAVEGLAARRSRYPPA